MDSEEYSKPYLSKRSVGFMLGLAVFFFFIFIPTPELFVDTLKSSIGSAANDSEVLLVAAGMQKVLALFLLMIIWWITEALPIPATALLPAVMLPLLHITGWADGRIFEFTFQRTLVSYANPVIALFFGCFLLAGAMQKWGVDKRITLWLLTRGKIAASPKLTLLVLMYATALLSMWISNTAAAAIMLPIAIGILSQSSIEPGKNKFGTALMLCIAWSASVGGVGTLIGTPPNGIAISILRQNGLQTVNFLEWMMFGVPYVVLFIPIIWFLALKLYPPEKDTKLNKEYLSTKRGELGKFSMGEILVSFVFLSAIFLWVSHPFWKYILPESIAQKLNLFDEYAIGLFVGLILFIIPINFKKLDFILTWKDIKFVQWGVLILFGGGLALSDAMFKTGLAASIASNFVYLFGTPSTLIMLFVILILITFMTEVTSNTAVTSMMVPVVIAIGLGTGNDPAALSIGAAISASMAFMLPVATPPNALVYGTGYIELRQMIKAGFWLNIIGCIFTLAILYFFGHIVFGIIKL